jgi:hypothetical protein
LRCVGLQVAPPRGGRLFIDDMFEADVRSVLLSSAH